MSRLFVLCALILIAIAACAGAALGYKDPEELADYVTLLDEQSNIIMQTGVAVHTGDEFINEDNRVYEVISIKGRFAHCRFVRTEVALTAEFLTIPAQATPDPGAPLVAIYHTHTDESYVPTDGKASDPGKGSIMEVGQAFADRLSALGLRVDHDNTAHDPHDANAYQRSRRTFMKLLNQQPAALFDIHRDSVPAQIYNTTINGQSATKILLVVGRQNQNRKTTMDYAKSIKAAADQKYKGLIRGIFIAHGNYNQDLNPRAILAEIGTEYNSLDQAKRSAALFADIVPSLLSASTDQNAAQAARPEAAGSPPPFSAGSGGVFQDIGYLLGALTLGTAAFLFLSTGSWREAKNKLKKLKDTEFGDLVRFGKRRR